jgi:hypothetical protein
MERFKLNCGDAVKDMVSGAGGIITARADTIDGQSKYFVKPRELKDGKPADGFWIDEGALTVIEKSAVARPIPPTDFLFELGDEVKDKWSDHRGVITGRVDHMYGCVRYDVQPRTLNKDGNPFASLNQAEGVLLLVKANKEKLAAKEKRPTTGAEATPPALDRRPSGCR